MNTTPDAQFEQRFVTATDGVVLAFRDYTPAGTATAAALPVVCLPGLSRNSRDFHTLAQYLSSDGDKPHRIISPDYRGRGRSGWADDKGTYHLQQETDDLLHLLDHLAIERAIFIGTSRGGLILHLLAARQKSRLAAVILNDIGPVIETAGLLGIRHSLEEQARYESWQSATSGLKAAHASAFPALEEQDWRDMAQAIFTEIDGHIVSDYDPALLEPLKQMEPGMVLPALWELYDGFSGLPLMAIRAEHSTILSQETLKEMARRQPQLRCVAVQGQGHVPLLHKEPLRSALTDFIRAV